jgi:hypothetical protein
MGKLAVYEKQMLASPDQQISLTDPDSRSMATSGRGSGVVGCWRFEAVMSFEVFSPAASLLTRRAAAFCLRCLQKRNETSSAKLILGPRKIGMEGNDG